MTADDEGHDGWDDLTSRLDDARWDDLTSRLVAVLADIRRVVDDVPDILEANAQVIEFADVVLGHLDEAGVPEVDYFREELEYVLLSVVGFIGPDETDVTDEIRRERRRDS